MMPASRAVSSGSPFFIWPARICRRASSAIRMWPRATASRAVTGLAPTSTMRMRPAASTCERRLAIRLSLDQEERETFERDGEIHALQLYAARHLERAGGKVQHRAHAGGG